jgi:hypothetical protein
VTKPYKTRVNKNSERTYERSIMSVKRVKHSAKHSKLARAFACGGNFKKNFLTF